ncbi:MAG: hypothetical protein MUO50_18175, partial [Longimicrobiales bacterium]|nr:hypothetical protein [Longimicrobiales bacterium]
ERRGQMVAYAEDTETAVTAKGCKVRDNFELVLIGKVWEEIREIDLGRRWPQLRYYPGVTRELLVQ